MADVVPNITGKFREAFEVYNPAEIGRWRQVLAPGASVDGWCWRYGWVCDD